MGMIQNSMAINAGLARQMAERQIELLEQLLHEQVVGNKMLFATMTAEQRAEFLAMG